MGMIPCVYDNIVTCYNEGNCNGCPEQPESMNAVDDRFMISDGDTFSRFATWKEVSSATPVKKYHTLMAFDLVELVDGTYLRGWGDGRYTFESDDKTPYAQVTRNDIPTTCGFIKMSEVVR